MKQTMRHMGWTLIIALTATLGWAQGSEAQQTQSQRIQEVRNLLAQQAEQGQTGTMPQTTQRRAMNQTIDLQQADRIIGMDIRDNAGVHLGSVKDIVLNSSRDQIGYLVVEHGGVAGVGAKSFAIPYSEFKVATESATEQPGGQQAMYDPIQGLTAGESAGQNQATAGAATRYLSVNFGSDSLERVDGVDDAYWPDEVGTNWRTEQRTEGEDATRVGEDQAAFRARRVSMLLDTDAHLKASMPGQSGNAQTANAQSQPAAGEGSTAGKAIGQLNDIALNLKSGRLVYGIVALETGSSASDGKLSPIPWNAITIETQPTLRAAVHAPSEGVLTAHAFNAEEQETQMKQLGERNYSRRVYSAFNQQGAQWEALGFIDPSQNDSSDDK